ncbi:MAG TPA: exodeoxyribonuclease VII large subunit [Casimicrobiaceae bacterium]|nr:exodeoxyribonuclease VII large subunit [Casimicrobiaceae bacterium]
MESATPSLAPVLPVSLLVGSARLLIERHLGLAWISGEISGFTRAASGHCYFMLKDEQAQVRCVLFRHKAQLLDIVLREGAAVEVRATPTIYEARGEFQLNVETVRLAGLGALYERFARLKARLEAAGWFAPERKRALPAFPLALGIVTSPRAAALRDVLTTLGRRFPGLPIILYPASVQGAGAADEIAAAIAAANAHAEVDVLVVCRGGGSIEDLWAFNEEVLARAVFESRIPVISGVGHETDFTICDFIADARAPTPTAAAALAVPDRAALRRQARAVFARWRHALARALELRMQRIDLVSRRLVHPAARIEWQRADLTVLGERLARGAAQAQDARRSLLAHHATAVARLLRIPPPARAHLDRRRESWQRAAAERIAATAQRIDACAQSLRHLNPLGVLDRGYSIVTDDKGAVVQDAGRLAIGDTLNVRFARGEAGSKVTRTRSA